jgi:hypothetical protein
LTIQTKKKEGEITMEKKVHYIARFWGYEGRLLTAARALCREVNNLYISEKGYINGVYMVTLSSSAPGPALPYYGNCGEVPPCHAESTTIYMIEQGGADNE